MANKKKSAEVDDALSVLFGRVSDDGAEQLEALALQEGWLWRCTRSCRNGCGAECGWNNSASSKTCEECKAPRPRGRR